MIDNRILLIPAPAFNPEGSVASEFPLGLYSLKEVCRKEGFAVDVLDIVGDIEHQEYQSVEEFGDALLSLFEPYSYDIIGISTMSMTFPISLYLAENIKRMQPETIVIMGGPHASFCSSGILRDFTDVDAIVIGEGEITLLEMLRSFRTSIDDWIGIPGVTLRKASFVPRDFIENIDNLPVILFGKERKLYMNGVNGDNNRAEGVRGCNATCRFCSTNQFWGCRVRRKSPARLLREMTQIAEITKLPVFNIIGDNFSFPVKAFRHVCGLIIESGFESRWKCHSRLGDLKNDDLKLLKDAGCTGIFVGVESASPVTLKRINKRINLDKTLNMIEEAIRLDMEIIVSQIIGFPWETEKDIQATLRQHSHLLDLGVASSRINTLIPLPGSEGFPDSAIITDFELIKKSLPYIYHDEYTEELIRKHPQHSIQFGYYETPHLRRSYIEAAIEASRQVTEMKSPGNNALAED